MAAALMLFHLLGMSYDSPWQPGLYRRAYGARRLSMSRASVGRLLDRARRVGLVSINLNTEYLDAFELSGELRKTFGLAEALVVPDHDKEPSDHHAMNARIGLGGAQFMSTHLRPGASLGVGWGETVSRVIAATSFGAVGPVHMVTLTGGVEGYLQTILSSKGEIASEPAPLTSATVIRARSWRPLLPWRQLCARSPPSSRS
jgi:lsr operon transcriptional repressor